MEYHIEIQDDGAVKITRISDGFSISLRGKDAVNFTMEWKYIVEDANALCSYFYPKPRGTA